MARAANWASERTGMAAVTPLWAWAANWLLSSVVTHPVSWVRVTSGLASSRMTSIFRWTAKERVKVRWARMWREAKARAVEPGRVVGPLGAERLGHPRDDGRSLAAVHVGIVDGILGDQLV